MHSSVLNFSFYKLVSAAFLSQPLPIVFVKKFSAVMPAVNWWFLSSYHHTEKQKVNKFNSGIPLIAFLFCKNNNFQSAPVFQSIIYKSIIYKSTFMWICGERSHQFALEMQDYIKYIFLTWCIQLKKIPTNLWDTAFNFFFFSLLHSNVIGILPSKLEHSSIVF